MKLGGRKVDKIKPMFDPDDPNQARIATDEDYPIGGRISTLEGDISTIEMSTSFVQMVQVGRKTPDKICETTMDFEMASEIG